MAKKQKVATLLIVKHGNSLSSQLEKRTGVAYSTQDFDVFEKGDFLKHKATGKCFVVMSKSYYDNLNQEQFKTQLAGYRKRFNLSAIRQK